MEDDYKIRPFHKMLQKTSYDGETTWMYFSSKDDELLKNIYITIFGINSAIS